MRRSNFFKQLKSAYYPSGTSTKQMKDPERPVQRLEKNRDKAGEEADE